MPSGRSRVLEGVRTTGSSGLLAEEDVFRLLEEVEAVSASDMMPGSSSKRVDETTCLLAAEPCPPPPPPPPWCEWREEPCMPAELLDLRLEEEEEDRVVEEVSASDMMPESSSPAPSPG